MGIWSSRDNCYCLTSAQMYEIARLEKLHKFKEAEIFADESEQINKKNKVIDDKFFR